MPDPVLTAVEGVPGDPNAPGPPPPPAPERSVDNQRRPVDPRSTDSGPTRPAVNAGSAGTPILASGVIEDNRAAVLAAANVVVRRALEIAGGRLLNRQMRGQFPNVPKFEIHTKVKVNLAQADEALAGAFDHLVLDFAGLGVDTELMTYDLRQYCRGLVSGSRQHSLERLKLVLDARA